MKDSDIKVSINCLTFNHEKYVRKTFEGFLAQKTDFKFEVLVHDDASTDGTQDIIREYTEKYPDIFKPIYQTENQYSKGIKVALVYNLPRAKGKYIAACEGDDYWCDEYKLQKQYNVMEQHPECSMCIHTAQIISEDGQQCLGTIPAVPFENGVIDEEVFLRKELINGWAAQTSSFFVRSECYMELIEESPLFSRLMIVVDFPTVLYMITKGKMFFLNEAMSCYRSGGASSFRKRRENNQVLELRHLLSMISGIEEYNQYTKGKYNGIIRTYTFIKLEQVDKVSKRLQKECEPYYLNEVYRGKEKSVRMKLSFFVRTRFPWIYRLLVLLYVKIKDCMNG